MMLRIDINRWFAVVAILNPKWPPIYKNPKIQNGYQQNRQIVNGL
jgi:hypothetical protein